MRSSDRPGYLTEFHNQRPGITEQVLRHARAADGDAYDWLAAALPAEDLVVDLACGNAALWIRLPGHAYLGLDASIGELAAARTRGVPTLARCDATALPLPDASIPVVTCSMALHILTPLDRVLAEIGRVLRPGGHLIATVPATGSLRPVDLPVIAGLLAALGRRLGYPNDDQLGQALPLLKAAGLRLTNDEIRRYPYPLRGSDDADLFLDSLYVPGLPSWRGHAARAYLRSLARVRVSLTVPIRRITAIKPLTVLSRQVST